MISNDTEPDSSSMDTLGVDPTVSMDPDTEENTPTEEVCRELVIEMAEDLVLELCFQVHRSLKLNYYAINEYICQDGEFVQRESDSDYIMCRELQALTASSKKPFHINCPHCGRKVGTNRFAPHLNGCMGEGGRQGKDRGAKRNMQIYESGDDEEDEDYLEAMKKSRKKKGKNQKKISRVVTSKIISGKMGEVYSEYSYFCDDMAEILMTRCGVMGRKLTSCKNTLQCNQHTDEQRREVRRRYLHWSTHGQYSGASDSNVHIDVDTVDEVSRSPSPAEVFSQLPYPNHPNLIATQSYRGGGSVYTCNNATPDLVTPGGTTFISNHVQRFVPVSMDDDEPITP